MSEKNVDDLEGRVAIVTGAASGIGLASALELSKRGAAVALLDANRAQLEKAVQVIGERSAPFHCDVQDEDSVRNAVEAVTSELGSPSVLHNNAGICRNGGGPEDDGPVHTLELATWMQTLTVNLTGCFLLAKHVLPAMIEAGRGSIINTASIGGNVYASRESAYAASKAGVAGLTRSMAAEYGKFGVRTNAICPGLVSTPMSRMARAEGDERDRVLTGIPLHRVADAKEIGEVVAFLASQSSSYMNGATIVIDGGMTLT